jgi:hypothetical protein
MLLASIDFAQAQSAPTPVWLTAVIAAGSAVFGALAGGYATYRANLALEVKRRTARVAIRRKAKVYTPLRAHLLELQHATEQDAHLDRGVARVRPNNKGHPRDPAFWLWEDLVADGRGLTSPSRTVAQRLDAVGPAIDALNQALEASDEIFCRHGRPAYEQLTGRKLLMGWPAGRRAEVIRDREGLWDLFGRPFVPENDRSVEMNEAFRAHLAGQPDVTQVRARVIEAERVLAGAASQALQALEEAMRRTAERYEQEQPEE